jgi:MFS family permease
VSLIIGDRALNVPATISACTALTKSYTGLLVCRLLLGAAEAPFYPGALYLLSIFYTRKEIATRISILYSALILATSFSGLIAAATFETLDGVHGLAGWRWLFIVEVSSLARRLPDCELTT